jgi:hypothetical protein
MVEGNGSDLTREDLESGREYLLRHPVVWDRVKEHCAQRRARCLPLSCDIEAKLAPDNPANVGSKEPSQHEMNPVPVCLVEANVRPPEGIEPTHATHSHLPVRVVQGD